MNSLDNFFFKKIARALEYAKTWKKRKRLVHGPIRKRYMAREIIISTDHIFRFDRGKALPGFS